MSNMFTKTAYINGFHPLMLAVRNKHASGEVTYYDYNMHKVHQNSSLSKSNQEIS